MGGFFLFDDVPAGGETQQRSGIVKEQLHKLECRACPLNTANVKSPKMKPSGADEPLVYMLGEAPGEDEDRKGKQFVGVSGQLLRDQIPDEWEEFLRWNNVIRDRPPKNRKPSPVEIECCRPALIRDIESALPAAIFGFGGTPLDWAIEDARISLWRGKRFPIRVGSHTCWYYPIYHPSYILRTRRREPDSDSEVGSELERVFRFDISHAFADVKAGLPTPKVYSTEEAKAGVHIEAENTGRIARFLAAAAKDTGVKGFDIETNGLRPYKAGSKFLSAAISTEAETLAFPLRHLQARWTAKELAYIEDCLLEFFDADVGTKAVHNLAFELEWLGVIYSKRLIRTGKWACTQAQAVILDERKSKGGSKSGPGGPKSLNFLCMQYFGIWIKQLYSLDKGNLDKAPLAEVLTYNGVDAKFHRLLYHAQHGRLNAEGFAETYREHMRRIPTCVLTQIKGVPINQAQVKSLVAQLQPVVDNAKADLAKLDVVKQFEKIKKEEFNPGSPQHVLFVLKDIMKRPEVVQDKEKWQRDNDDDDEGGTTGKAVLSKIDHPFPKLVLAFREPAKLLSTYVLPSLPTSDVVHNNRFHPQLNTVLVDTWRSSSDDPNIQNWPKRGKYTINGVEHSKKDIRKIVADPTLRCVAFDYGQIQVRNIAMESKDATLVKALWERHDIHQDWAEKLAFADPARIGGRKFLTDEKVLKAWRGDEVKGNWTFALFFGSSRRSVAERLKIDEDKIAPLYDEFWETYEGVHKWQSGKIRAYEKLGWVDSLAGFRRRAPLTKHQIINSPIQADEAIIVLDAHTRLSETGDPLLQANLEIHDDLSFFLPAKSIDKYAERIVDIMLACPYEWVNVPIVIEMSEGPSWGELEEIEKFASDEWKR